MLSLPKAGVDGVAAQLEPAGGTAAAALAAPTPPPTAVLMAHALPVRRVSERLAELKECFELRLVSSDEYAATQLDSTNRDSLINLTVPPGMTKSIAITEISVKLTGD